MDGLRAKIARAYERFDGDPRVAGPDNQEAFTEAVLAEFSDGVSDKENKHCWHTYLQEKTCCWCGAREAVPPPPTLTTGTAQPHGPHIPHRLLDA
jgi:hypothetical protein